MRNNHLLATLVFTVLLLTACNGRWQAHIADQDKTPGIVADNGTNNGGYQWKQLTANAAFPKSYNFQLFSFRDTLWAFHPSGNWFSLDGKDWTKSKLVNSIANLAFLDYVQFDNSILGLGKFSGNIEQYDLSSSIFKTVDMRNWKTLKEESNLPRRFFYHPFVFDNKIWIIGGSDGRNEYSDIWSSADAVNWTKQADQMPFGKRQQSQIVTFRNKLYLLDNDVWSSNDAIHWTKETDAIAGDKSIFGYTAVVYQDRIWLLGCSRDGKFKSEILVSEDGKTWTEQRAPWTPRGGIAAVVHKGKLYITGGKYGGPGIAGQTEFVYSNDVWVLNE